MKVTPTSLPDVLLLEARVFEDARGLFYESYSRRAFREATGLDPKFVQDNQSLSRRGVLRGLHYQVLHPQGKLVRVTLGDVWDVAVDLRQGSPSFGRWCGVALSDTAATMLWIPPGFAHGFYVTSEAAEVQYKATDYYAPEYERTLQWNDPDLGIDWPLHGGVPELSEKDGRGAPLARADVYDSALHTRERSAPAASAGTVTRP
jgi:dTDP-4-dehydrorhamnose 3,5-epimerase